MMKRLQVGEKIGDYSILGFLGAGGMGEVYQGLHTKLNRPAAIKVLSGCQDNSTFTTRFFNEARLQSSLHHPNIIALYDFQEIDNQLYIFMEFADGESLEDLIKRRAFTVEDALKTFNSICEAVAFIHCNGIVHRDIKAQNVKLTSAGEVKLLDFGIAKDSASDNLTQTGGIVGTPHYLAPEQFSGKKASPQTDVWSLGILLYEMLTGEKPFQAEAIGSLCYQITMAEVPAPEAINPTVTKNISKIVARCLKKNPAERYQSVDEILADVRRVLQGERTSANAFDKTLNFFNKNETKVQSDAYQSYQSNPFPAQAAEPSGNYVSSDYYESDSPVETPKRKLPIGLIAGISSAAVIILFFIVGVSIWALRSSNSNPVLAKNSSIPNPVVSKNTRTVAAQSTMPNENLRRVSVEVDEGSAQVFRNNQLVGTTPFGLEGVEGETVHITLKREGFESQDVAVDITTRKKVVTVSLKPKR